MKIERFEIPGLAQYSYAVSDGGCTIIIDPMRDFERYTAYATQHGLKITHVTETHIHADFVSGAAALAQAIGAELALSAYDEGEHYQYQMQHRPLRDGDVLEAGMIRLRTLHTPGHTPEHLSFVLFDLGRSATEPVAIFTGDFLFVGSLGRPDLLGDEAKKGLARDLYRSLHERIASLADGVQVYPGHGAGSLCGAGMSESTESTLGYERATQPLFALAEERFVAELLASVPAMPMYYPRMKALNALGASPAANLPCVSGLTAAEFAARLRQLEVTVLDLRRPEAFGGAHIAGAINIGAGQNLSLWAGWLLQPERPILLVSEEGEVEDSRQALLRVGLDRIEGYLENGMIAWIDAGMDFARTRQLSIDEVLHRSGDELVLDVRSNAEWATGFIEGAHHIMLGDLPTRLGDVPKSQAIITVCGSGYRSSIAASLLQQHGQLDIASMDGGMGAWNRRGLPVVAAKV